jgi:hypothetical protein
LARTSLLAFVIVATTWLCVRHLRAILRNQTYLEILLNKLPEVSHSITTILIVLSPTGFAFR